MLLDRLAMPRKSKAGGEFGEMNRAVCFALSREAALRRSKIIVAISAKNSVAALAVTTDLCPHRSGRQVLTEADQWDVEKAAADSARLQAARSDDSTVAYLVRRDQTDHRADWQVAGPGDSPAVE
jgi:hypothetical protein